MSFGGKSWPIDVADMNLGRLSATSSQCVGGIFDLGLGSNIGSGQGNPSWVVGATFLKNVYSVFRSNPPSIGFAQLSDAAGGSGAVHSSPASSPAPSSNPLLTTSLPTSTSSRRVITVTSSSTGSPTGGPTTGSTQGSTQG
ncbi:hypothetical protein H0H87_004329, partial [Tephrocybe sp. NHM501043]